MRHSTLKYLKTLCDKADVVCKQETQSKDEQFQAFGVVFSWSGMSWVDAGGFAFQVRETLANTMMDVAQVLIEDFNICDSEKGRF